MTIFIFYYPFALFNTITKFAFILSVTCFLLTISGSLTKLKFTFISVFLNIGILPCLRIFSFLFYNFKTLSVFNIVFKFTLILNSFCLIFDSLTLFFTIDEISIIHPQEFFFIELFHGSFTMRSYTFDLTTILIKFFSKFFGYDHILIFYTLIIKTIFDKMISFFVYYFFVANKKFDRCGIFKIFCNFLNILLVFRSIDMHLKCIINLFNSSISPHGHNLHDYIFCWRR
jgi:hypothetical protein